MKVRIVPGLLFVLLIGLVALLACGSPASPEAAPTQAPSTPAPTTESAPASVTQSAPDTGPSVPSGAIRQWASEAEASSEYGSSDFSASQATGAPNTPDCGDIWTAWASANQETVEWLNVYFKEPVYPSAIQIVQTFYPDQVAKVEIIDMQGQFISVYTGLPRQVDSPCPYTLSIPVSQSDTLAQGVRITIDQTVVRNWNEIDAVEIIGVPGEGTPVRPATP